MVMPKYCNAAHLLIRQNQVICIGGSEAKTETWQSDFEIGDSEVDRDFSNIANNKVLKEIFKGNAKDFAKEYQLEKI